MRGRWLFFRSGSSLRLRLISLSLAALLPTFAVIAFTQYEVTESRQQEVEALALRSAKQAAFELNSIISGIGLLLDAVAKIPDVHDMREPGCSSYFADIWPNLKQLATLGVIGADGRFRCGLTQPSSANLSFIDRSYFRDALASQNYVIGEYTFGRGSKRAVLPIALAIRDRDSHPLGVLVASLDLMWLGEQVKERGLPPGGSVTVADRSGTIIAREPLSDAFVGTRIPGPFMRLVDAPTSGVEVVMSQDGTRRVLGYVPVSEPPHGLYVSAGLSAEASYEAVNRATRVSLLLAASGALGTILATWWIGSRAFVDPIQHLIRVIEGWRKGDRIGRTGMTRDIGEIGALGAEIDQMMDEIVSNQEHRQLLANELAHRVKNTLATVQAIARSTMNRPEPGRELLPDYLARIASLSHVNDVLIREQWESARLRDIVLDVTRPLVTDIEARLRLEGPDVDLPAREALGMTMVVHELCTNALKYGAFQTAAGHVEVFWSVQDGAEGTILNLTWREQDGPPVSPPAGKAGFGTRLIARAFGHGGKVRIEFRATGVSASMTLVIRPASAGPQRLTNSALPAHAQHL